MVSFQGPKGSNCTMTSHCDPMLKGSGPWQSAPNVPKKTDADWVILTYGKGYQGDVIRCRNMYNSYPRIIYQDNRCGGAIDDCNVNPVMSYARVPTRTVPENHTQSPTPIHGGPFSMYSYVSAWAL